MRRVLPRPAAAAAVGAAGVRMCLRVLGTMRVLGLLGLLGIVGAVGAASMLPGPCECAAQGTLVWHAYDPVGDDNGPGTYVYPTNPAFAPFSGIFDLTEFRVEHDAQNVYFDMVMAAIANTWNAPDGFSHQLVNVYIDTTPNAGRVDTLRDGAFVLFDPRHAWDVNVRVMGWGGTRVYTALDDPDSAGKSDGVSGEALSDGKTIRAMVPKAIIGEPSDAWKYYVTVASQDGYGPDNHRPVTAEGGAWVFGGGCDLDVNPNVIDVLAPESGSWTQQKQLGSWSESQRRLAVLYPANADARFALGVERTAVAAACLLVLAALGFIAVRVIRGRRGDSGD